MTTSALILMVLVQLTITGFFGYFFLKVIRTPPKTEGEQAASDSQKQA